MPTCRSCGVWYAEGKSCDCPKGKGSWKTLEDYEDLRALRAAKAKEKSAKSISLKEAKRVLNLN